MAVQTTYTSSANAVRSRGLANQPISKTVRVSGLATTIASGDETEVFLMPKGAVVHAISSNVVTVEGAAETADLGVIGALTTFNSNLDLNTLGSTAGTAGYTFTSDAAIVLHADAELAACVVDITVVYSLNDVIL